MIRLEVTATVELDSQARTVRVVDSTVDAESPPAGQDPSLFAEAVRLIQRGALLRQWPLTPRERRERVATIMERVETLRRRVGP